MVEYRANTHVSFNVMLNGEKIHISFNPLTGGGSMFTTDDKDLITALDKINVVHHLFSKHNVEVKPDIPAKPQVKTNIVTIKVTCIDDAKDYIANTFGISRSMLRSKASILKAAKDNNIVFEGLE